MKKPESSLRELPFFSGLSDKNLQLIISCGKRIKYEKEEIIFNDGDLCHAIYIVESGKIKLYKLGDDGNEHILHFAEAGDTFGGAPIFLENGKYPAFAEAKVDSVVLLIPKVILLKTIKENPYITLRILNSFSKYLNLLVESIDDISLSSVSKRVAKYLVKLAEQTGAITPNGVIVEINLSRQDLAGKLGTVREVVSRAFSSFNKKGLIKIDGKKIIIQDLKKLVEL